MIVQGNVGIGKTNPGQALDVNGTVKATAFSGSGASLTSLNASSLSTGTIANAQTSAISASGADTIVLRDGSGNFSAGTVTALGNLALPNTTSSTTGVMTLGGNRFLHNYGSSNTFVGQNAGNFTMSGYSNTALGIGALQANSTGVANTASGHVALGNITNGIENTALGSEALGANTDGHFNTAVGSLALAKNTGTSNIAIGRAAGYYANSGSNNIYIGHTAEGLAAEGSTIRIGTGGAQTKAFIAGINGVTTGGAAVAVLVDNDGQLGTVSSSRRFKEDIRDMSEASHRLLQLRPVTFRYKQAADDGSKPLQYGLIAEEVAEVFPELVAYDKDGQPETVFYHVLPGLLLNEVQRQEAKVSAQETELAALKAEVTTLRAALNEQSRQQSQIRQLQSELEGLKARLGVEVSQAVASDK